MFDLLRIAARERRVYIIINSAMRVNVVVDARDLKNKEATHVATISSLKRTGAKENRTFFIRYLPSTIICSCVHIIRQGICLLDQLSIHASWPLMRIYCRR